MIELFACQSPNVLKVVIALEELGLDYNTTLIDIISGKGREPEFLAMDGKNAVLADADGISLGKNGRTTELSWDSVVFAECVREAQRGLSVLRVDVVLPDGSVSTGRVTTRYPAELEAWIWHFNAVLIRYARFAGRL